MSIYLISDLHLNEKNPAITTGFFSYLQSLPDDTESLYILGDFFEFWVGDDDNRPLVVEVQRQLQRLSEKNIPIYFQHGNRDFLLGESFAKKCNMTLLKEEHLLEYQGHQYLLMHGDSLCVDDTEYMAFRAQTHSPTWKENILKLPLEERYQLAQTIRTESQQQSMSKNNEITDVNLDAVTATLTSHNIKHLIHGHTHRPNRHTFIHNNQTYHRTVLGDWSTTKGWHIKIDEHSLNLIEFNL
jgi:UDP-2,3-diacylglucosamine hydrolase